MARDRSVTPNSRNTALYTRVATKTISEVVSPLGHIALKLKSAAPPT
jgi:hypothetical protein